MKTILIQTGVLRKAIESIRKQYGAMASLKAPRTLRQSRRPERLRCPSTPAPGEPAIMFRAGVLAPNRRLRAPLRPGKYSGPPSRSVMPASALGGGKLHLRPACRFSAGMRSSHRRGRRRAVANRQREDAAMLRVVARLIAVAWFALSLPLAVQAKTFYWISHGSPADPVWTYFLAGAELGQGHGSNRQDIVPQRRRSLAAGGDPGRNRRKGRWHRHDQPRSG